MINALDTLWNSVRTRWATINSSRKLMGIMDAQDFPPQVVEFDAVYMLVLADQPLGRQADSAAVPVFVHTVQFTWVNEGSDIGTEQNSDGRNRGDRYRVNRQMIHEMVQALYPRFAQAIQLPTGNQLANASSFQIETLNLPILWTYPSFNSRADKGSGLIYQTCTVRVTGMFSQPIAA